jgi:DNA repair protein RadD
LPVVGVEYSQNVKHKESGDSVTLRVMYRLSYETNLSVSEFLCFGHASKFARDKAASWWRRRSSAPVPDTVMDALALANKGALSVPRTVTTARRYGDKYPEIVGYDLPSEPPFWEWPDAADEDFFDAEPVGAVMNPDDIPF